jgi:hypothetical protein
MTMRRGHHTSGVLKAMNHGADETADDLVETGDESDAVEPE